MKNLFIIITIILFSCSSTNKPQINYKYLNCIIVEIKEYQNTFRFKALNNNDTILIVSLKDNYYNKKIHIDSLEEIRLDKNYNFYLTQIKPIVLNMEELGAFVKIEGDTLWKSSTYKNIPLTYLSHNTIGKFYSKNHLTIIK